MSPCGSFSFAFLLCFSQISLAGFCPQDVFLSHLPDSSGNASDLQDEKLLERIRNQGVFQIASQEHRGKILDDLLRWDEKIRKTPNDVQVFRIENIGAQDLFSIHQAALEYGDVRLSYDQMAIAKIKSKARLSRKLEEFGYQSIAPLALVEGFAGLWTRGHGVVKALFPINLSEVMTEEKLSRLKKLSHQYDDASKQHPPNADLLATTGEEITQMTLRAMSHPKAKNPVLLKLIQAAILSKIARSYFVMELWTSKHTHSTLKKYMDGLPNLLPSMELSEDPVVDREIKSALLTYLAAGKKIQKGHLFGYQIGLHLIREQTITGATGAPHSKFSFDEHSPAISEGAGKFKDYLDETGRTTALSALGVEHYSFRNAEVLSPIHLEYFSFLMSDKPFGLVTVPIPEGEKPGGGAVYRITEQNTGQPRYVMLEDFDVHENVRKNNHYLNANTAFLRANLSSPQEVTFERKGSGLRIKVTAGGFSHEHETVAIAGSIPENYVHLKNFDEYYRNGAEAVKIHLKHLTSMLHSHWH